MVSMEDMSKGKAELIPMEDKQLPVGVKRHLKSIKKI